MLMSVLILDCATLSYSNKLRMSVLNVHDCCFAEQTATEEAPEQSEVTVRKSSPVSVVSY